MEHRTDIPAPGAPMMRLAGVDDDQYDALADLFLGESELAPEPLSNATPDHAGPTLTHLPEPDASPRREEPHAIGALPMIEMLVLGHLPVRAALWVRQYACSVARRCNERVALVRLASGSVSVDLINSSSNRKGLIPEHAHAKPQSLREALAHAAEIADRVVLRVDETCEPEILGRDEIDTLTILTGADEAAVVASYRFIKSTTREWEEHDAIGVPHIRLAVMGANAEQAAQASVKLTRAIDAFLERPIEIVDAAGRIDSTATQNLFQGHAEIGGASLLDTLIESSLGLGEQDLSEQNDAAPERDLEPHAIDTPTPEIVVPEPASAAHIPPSRVSLCDLLEGLTRLVTKCPLAPDVELAADPSGKLHLVCSDEHTNASLQLESARTWVRDHLDLIIRAEPRVSLPIASRDEDATTLHLLANEPRSWRSLIDSDVRLYALASVKVGTRNVRTVTPIN